MGVGLAKRCRTLVVAKACVRWPAGAAGETTIPPPGRSGITLRLRPTESRKTALMQRKVSP